MPRDTGMSYLVFIKQLQFSGMSGLGEGMRSTACQFSHWRVMLMLTEVWIWVVMFYTLTDWSTDTVLPAISL